MPRELPMLVHVRAIDGEYLPIEALVELRVETVDPAVTHLRVRVNRRALQRAINDTYSNAAAVVVPGVSDVSE